jgi:membrane-associated protease RseP (regulator of RpoE activity)
VDVTSPIRSFLLLGPALTPDTIRLVWSDPELLLSGLRFSLPALFILLCHELGHYLACRRYRLHATLPYFVPAPFGFGTLGAFIRIRSPIAGKRQLFDVGVAGPLAGFAALLPFLVYGIAHSTPTTVELAEPSLFVPSIVQPGSCLALELLTRVFHGPLAADQVLDLHPYALAGWLGLLATAINLLPLGQLDGGHLLYAVVGRLQGRLALPLWLVLAAAGFFNPMWFVWAMVVALLGLRHPPLADESLPLGGGRLLLALVAAAILVLSFMPEPLTEVFVYP